MKLKFNRFLNKPLTQRILFALFLIILAVFFLRHLIPHQPIYVDNSNIAACTNEGKTHSLKILNSKFSPEKITARLCDQLVLENQDSSRVYKIAFGKHKRHLVYPNFKEQYLKPSSKVVIILKASGVYSLHDHIKDETTATIEITP